MPLLRKSSKEQLKKIDSEIKKEGGDITSKYKPSDAEQKSNNSLGVRNIIEGDKKGKHIIDTYEDFITSQKSKKSKMVKENTDNDSPQEIMKNMKNIRNWVDFNSLPMSSDKRNRDILIAGKPIKIGDVNGYINRIEGNNVYVEVIGGDIKKYTIKEVLKAYKPTKEETKIVANLDLTGPNTIEKKKK